MSDSAELNALIVDNLADLEAATRQIEEVIEPMVKAELLRLAAEFLEAHPDWGGDADDAGALWLAPEVWRDADGGEGEYLCYYELRAVQGRDAADRFWLSALTDTGSGRVGLHVVSDRIGDVPLGRLFAADAELVQRLQAHVFIYDVARGRALYLPLTLDRDQLAADLRVDSLNAAFEPVRHALDAAATAAPLLEPLAAKIAAAGL